MADPKQFADQWLPNLTPEQRESWLKSYAPPAPPPGQRVINAPETVIEGPAPTSAATDRALGQLAGRPPEVSRVFGAPPPQVDADAAAAERLPKNGDWAGARKAQEKAQADGRAANVAGATFYSPSGPGAGGATSAPVLVSKGGRTPATWGTQTQEGVKLSDDTKKKAETAEGARVDAAEAGRDAGIAEAHREVAILDEHARLQAAHADEMRRRQEEERKRMGVEMAKLNAYTSKVQRQEIDPDEWKGSGAGLLGAALAIMAGAVGQAYQIRGGIKDAKNQGLEMVNQAIAQNIDAQKANAAQNNRKLENQRNVLGEMTRTFGEGERAEQAAWIQYLEHAKTRLAAAASESKSDFAQARYRQAIADIDGEIAGRREKWDQLTQDHVTRVQHDVNAPAQYAGGAPVLSKHDREETSKISEELTKAGIPQARSALADIDRTIDTFGEGDIAGVGPIKDHIPSMLISDEGVRNRQAVAHVKNGLRKEVAGATLTEDEKVELNKELEGSHDAASLRRVVQSFRQSLHKKEVTIRALGSDVANQEFDRRQGTNESRAVPINAPSVPHVKAPQ